MSNALRALRGLADDEALAGPAIPSTNLASFVEWFLARGGSPDDVALPFPVEELRRKGKERWISYREHLLFQKSMIDRIDAFTLPLYYDMGRFALRNKLLDSYRILASLVPRRGFFQLMTRLTGFLQGYTRIVVLEERRGYCRLRYDVDPAVNAYALGGLAHNITGFVAAAIEFRFGSSCAYRIIRNQNLLSNAALAAYERYDLAYAEDESGSYLGGIRFASRLAGDPCGLRIIDNVRRNGLLLFERGMIFDSPYCEAELEWEERPSLQGLASKWLRWLGSGFSYPAALEGKLAEAQRNYLGAERSRTEAEGLSAELEVRNRELVALVGDLEARVHARTAELEEALERIRHDDLVKTNLLASLSHELRTPMTLISLPLGRLAAGERGPTVPCDDEYILAALRHAGNLVETLDGILDFTAVSAKRGILRREPIELDALAREVIADFGYEAGRRSISLEMENLVPVTVVGEPRLLRTALVNLVQNALKYSEAGGRISVGLSLCEGLPCECGPEPGKAANRSALLSVADTGRGLEPEELDRLFDRGYRAPSATGEPGWGLGLSLVKDIAEAHGGSVSCSSRKSRGAVFLISLPIEETSARPTESRYVLTGASASEASERPLFGPGEGDRPLVLYVEDNAELSSYIVDRLSRSCEVRTAYDAEAAEAMLLKERHDIVISDVMLPGRDGLELYRRIKARIERPPPFLFVTARADEALREAALDEGAVDYIGKPFSEVELELKVRNLAAFARLASPACAGVRRDMEAGTRRAFAERGASAREIEVALLLGEGLARKEIAARLGIATATVKRHVENLFARLGVADRFQLFARYFGPASLIGNERFGDNGNGSDLGGGSDDDPRLQGPLLRRQ